MKRCPFCAEEIQDAAVVCKHCHRDLPSTAQIPAQQPQVVTATPSSGSRWVWSAVGIVIAVLLGLMGLLSSGAPDRNEAHERLIAATDAQREQILEEAVGPECDAAYFTFYKGIDPKDKTAYWSIRCRNGKAFMVRVGADQRGRSRYVDCAVMKAVGSDDCFKEF